jgi:hypothetical protein
MTWKAPFDEPIRLANGKALRTLQDAARDNIALPPRETSQLQGQTAMFCLLAAAERRGPLMIARIAMIKALGDSDKVTPSERLGRAAKRYTSIK